MRISYTWLKQYIDLDVSPEELSKLLTNCGLEVESLDKFETVKGGLKGVVIGEVLTCTRHPNADKLSLTTVDVGEGQVLPIVCGAPNVAAGQKVPVATVGTVLHQGEESFEIKEARIRGELSKGMICAEDELGLGTSHDGIMVLDPDAKPGTPARDYFNIHEDHVFEIGLTPNRTDAMSHIGVARDIVAVLNQHKQKNYDLKLPDLDGFRIDNHDLEIPVEVEDPSLCPRYSGITLAGVKVGPSPAWLKDLLLAAGIRPINNVVDITNYVLMEVGQPLHAFDVKAIQGKRIVVRRAVKGEKFITLDEKERDLVTGDLMICNAREGMCIAGVFGGLHSGVTETTSDLFLESAHFNPRSIRRTSRHHLLQTDASFRFERGSDPNITVWALKRAALLIRELAGGKISSEIVDVYPDPVKEKHVVVNYGHVDRLAGKKIARGTIKKILQDLGIKLLKESDDGLEVAVPTFKVDVEREADIIEEILRIYGYDNIGMPGALRSSLSFSAKPDEEKLRNLISDMLVGKGFTEIMNNSLTSVRYSEKYEWLGEERSVKIMNPLSSDLGAMRQTLLIGGLETIAFNRNRKITDLSLFEFGRVYQLMEGKQDGVDPLEKYSEKDRLSIFMSGSRMKESWRRPQEMVDFFDVKSATHQVLDRLGIDIRDLDMEEIGDEPFEYGLTCLHRGNKLVSCGMVSHKMLEDFDIRQDVFYTEFHWENLMQGVKHNQVSYSEIPKFPSVRRDLALVIDTAVTFDDLAKAAYQAESKLLKKVSLFDIYKDEKLGQNKKSYALLFILQDENRTLTDKVIDQAMKRIQQALEEKFHAVLR